MTDIDITTPAGRAELREQIANAEPRPQHAVIEELTREIMCGFLGEKRANEVLRQKNALGAIDNYRRAAQRVLDAGWSHQPAAVDALPALLDALDHRERLAETSRTRELNAEARAEAAEAALDRVRALHQPAPNSCSALHPEPLCRGCGADYPCDNVRALDGDQPASERPA